jgi:hypothetical protein
VRYQFEREPRVITHLGEQSQNPAPQFLTLKFRNDLSAIEGHERSARGRQLYEYPFVISEPRPPHASRGIPR